MIIGNATTPVKILIFTPQNIISINPITTVTLEDIKPGTTPGVSADTNKNVDTLSIFINRLIINNNRYTFFLKQGWLFFETGVAYFVKQVVLYKKIVTHIFFGSVK